MAEDDNRALGETLPGAGPFGEGDMFAGRYRILGSIGRGGMGAVYRAEDRHVGDVVALKLITAAGAIDTETVERFRREVRLARRITHRNVARIHDLETHEGVHFLTMELIEGRDLERTLADEGTLSPRRATRLGREICEALAAAHDAGVVHRDLKPGNVLLETSGRVVVTDFGIARSLADDSAHATGAIGTPTYMAPEQIQGRAVDERTDLYALGGVLYELLVGEPPFEASTALATAVARLQQPAPDPREHARIPDGLAELINRLLSREPQGRPASARQVADELASAAESSDARRSSPSSRSSSDAYPARSTPSLSKGERRHVAVLFADLAQADTGDRRVDPEEMDAALGRCLEVASRVVERHGGEIERQPGGGAMVTFGWPVARGNDTERAARTALELHAELAKLQPPLASRVGLASGPVVARPGQAPVGDPLVQAARLREAAAPGQTRLGEAARIALGERAQCEPAADAAQGWKLVGLRAPDADDDRPFVGRRSELRLLDEVLESCRDEGSGRIVRVRGDAGIGKSRLVGRVRQVARGHRFACHTARALDFGVAQGRGPITTLAASLLGLAEGSDTGARTTAAERAVREGRLDERARGHLYDVLDLPLPDELQGEYDAMTNEARRRGRQDVVVDLVREAASLGPILITVEDVHWVDAPTREHLERLMAVTGEAPVVLVLTTRLDGDPFEGALRSASLGRAMTSIDLARLAAKDARELAGHYLDTDSELARRCIERAEGNPLFLAQLLCCTDLEAEGGVPGSIHSLVLARTDQLEPRDRAALRAASVAGQRFSIPVLRHLLGDPGYDCTPLIEAYLVRREGEDLSFVHALVRDAVYSSLLRDTRRDLHTKAAEWFSGPDPLLHAEHLDRADDPEAGAAYLRAGRALAASYHFERALEALRRGLAVTDDDVSRYELTCLLGATQRNLGEVEDSIESYRQAVTLARQPSQRCRAWIGVASGLRAAERQTEALEALDQPEREAEEHDLSAQLAEICYLRGNLSFMSGDAEGCLREHGRGIEHARRAGSVELEARCLGGLGDAHYMHGRMRTAHGHFERCVELSRRHGLVRVEVANHYMVGWTGIYLGRLSATAEQGREVAELARRVRHGRAELLSRMLIMHVSLSQLELERAREEYDRACAVLEQLPIRTIQANLEGLAAQLDVLEGERAQARERLDPWLGEDDRLVRTFAGPTLFARRALAATDESEARRMREQGERLLPGSVAHNHAWFRRYAIDSALQCGEHDEVDHHAAELEKFAEDEPFPWVTVQVDRARSLAAWGRGERGVGLAAQLRSIRERAADMTMHHVVEQIDHALANA